jgi:hypothetical protein
MADFQEYFSGQSSEWLDVLPKYQRDSVEELLATEKSYDDVAEAWLAATVAHDTFGFGAAQSAKIFYNKVLDQIHDLICTGKGYEAERTSVLAEFKKGQALAVAAVTEAISPHVGAASAFLSVAVVLAFATVSKIGKNAWCEMQLERRSTVNGTK